MNTLQDRIRERENYYNISLGKKQSVEQSIHQCEEIILSTGNEVDLLEKTALFLQKVADFETEKVKNKIEKIINFGLQSVFDNGMSFKIVPEIKRNQVEMGFKLEETLSTGEVVQSDLLDSHGGGIVNLVSFLLRLVVLLFSPNNFQKIMVLDESFNNISVDYREKVSDLLKRLSEKLGIQFILITHFHEFSLYADKVFEINKKDNHAMLSLV